MIPIKAIRTQMGELLAADATYLAPAVGGNKVQLVKSAFVPSENLALAGVTVADFDGSAALALGTGTQPVGVDPATGQQRITMLEPAGGLRWETTGVTNLPQTIYGYIMTNNAGTVLLASELLDEAVTLTAAGQEVAVGQARLNILDAAIE